MKVSVLEKIISDILEYNIKHNYVIYKKEKTIDFQGRINDEYNSLFSHIKFLRSVITIFQGINIKYMTSEG